MVKADGKEAPVWGLPPRPMFDQKVVAGRWFTDREETGSAAVPVIAKNMATAIGAKVGDAVTIQTACARPAFTSSG